MQKENIHDTFDPSKLVLTENQKYCFSLFEYQSHRMLSRPCIDFLLAADLIEIDVPYYIDWKKQPLERAECKLNERGMLYREWLRDEREKEAKADRRYWITTSIAIFGAITGAVALLWNLYQQGAISALLDMVSTKI